MKTANDGSNEWNNSIRGRVKGLTKKAYGWSKYGGVNLGLVQETKTEIWFCSTCGDALGSQMPCFMFEFEPQDGEFFRICSACQYLKLIKHLEAIGELLSLVRNHKEIWE